MKFAQKGFTIVEILVVIIVIGILASVTIVGYRGAQDRAEYAKAQSDLKNINDAIVIYKSQKGRYPDVPQPSLSANGLYYDFQNYYSPTPKDSFIEPLSSENFIDKMPLGTFQKGSYAYSYVYITNPDGTDYKLIRFTYNTSLPNTELSGNPLADPIRPTTAWGYWSSDTSKGW